MDDGHSCILSCQGMCHAISWSHGNARLFCPYGLSCSATEVWEPKCMARDGFLGDTARRGDAPPRLARPLIPVNAVVEEPRRAGTFRERECGTSDLCMGRATLLLPISVRAFDCSLAVPMPTRTVRSIVRQSHSCVRSAPCRPGTRPARATASNCCHHDRRTTRPGTGTYRTARSRPIACSSR